VSEQPIDPQKSPMDEDDIHLRRLLAPPEVPWYKTLVANVKDLINPPKLPPLVVTSKPVYVKSQWGMYGGNGARSGIMSLAIHVSVIALMVWIGSLKPVQKLVQETVTMITAPNLKPYMAEKKQTSGGGGGGGNRSPLDASKGKLPKPAPKQFTPPRVDPLENPKLPMPASIIAPPDVPNITASNNGDPLSNLSNKSNGIGFGGGIGSGSGGGVGSGKGPGVGPGSGGGFGGGAYRIGGGVSQPQLLSKVEPEYSEEARKAKWQGVVVLSLIVDETGLAQNIKVVRSLGMGLDQKAIEAVQKWRFVPGKKDNKPVPVYATIEVNFRLL
jgi:periplasmic protein TonB